MLATNAGALPGYDSASRVSVANLATLAVRAGGSGEWDSAQIDSLLGSTAAAFVSGSKFGIDVATGNTFSYGNDIGATQAAKGLVKSGSGTLTLSTTNSYTGATAVNGGILNITGSTASSSAVAVGGTSATGTPKLSGSGTINGAVTVKSAGVGGAAGILSAGDSTSSSKVGTLTMGNTLEFESGSIFEWDINANKSRSYRHGGHRLRQGDGKRQYHCSHRRHLQGCVRMRCHDHRSFLEHPNITQTWDIATIFGKSFTTGAFSPTVQTSTDVSPYGSFTISGTSLTWTAVPEPTSALVGLLITAGLLRRRRGGVMFKC